MNLFGERKIKIAEDAWHLPSFVLMHDKELSEAIRQITTTSPLRNMVTRNGYSMSVAMTNCGEAGWVTDKSGYRYQQTDPASGTSWPSMPDLFRELARTAANEAGFFAFRPDACLINQYRPEAKMSLHQDKDEKDFGAPIVSFSLGLPAKFMFGGLKRTDPIKRLPLAHGDVVVWGGAARLNFHGVAPVKPGEHPLFGNRRINLTFRKAL